MLVDGGVRLTGGRRLAGVDMSNNDDVDVSLFLTEEKEESAPMSHTHGRELMGMCRRAAIGALTP